MAGNADPADEEWFDHEPDQASDQGDNYGDNTIEPTEKFPIEEDASEKFPVEEDASSRRDDDYDDGVGDITASRAYDDDDDHGYVSPSQTYDDAPAGGAYNHDPAAPDDLSFMTISPKPAGATQKEDTQDTAASLREELRMEQEDRLAVEQELKKARTKIEALKKELGQLKSKSLESKEHEHHTVLEAKGQLEGLLQKVQSEQQEEMGRRTKAEQDLTFEQEVRRAAATSRDEAEKLLGEEKHNNGLMQQELESTRLSLAGAEEARRLAEEAAAKDRDALNRRDEDVMRLRIELGEKEAEVRHASKMENLQCSVEYEKLRSELEWKTKMLTNECEDLEQRLEESDARRQKMEQAVMQVNNEMRMRKQEGDHMMKMLDQVLQRTEGARSTEDSKLRELSAVRDSVQALKEEANRQQSMLEQMKEVNMTDFDVPKQPRRRKFDAGSPNRAQMPTSMNRSPGYGVGAGRRGGAQGIGTDIGSELDEHIRQIEDELTIKLPPLDSHFQSNPSPPVQQAGKPPKRGAQARSSKAVPARGRR